MIGPLPRLYRFTTMASAIAVFVALGLVLGLMPEVALVVRTGLFSGALLGLAAGWLLVHQPRRSRVRTR